MFRYFVDGTGVTVIKDTHTIFQDIFSLLKSKGIFTAAFNSLSQEGLCQVSAKASGDRRTSVTRAQQVYIRQKSIKKLKINCVKY